MTYFDQRSNGKEENILIVWRPGVSKLSYYDEYKTMLKYRILFISNWKTDFYSSVYYILFWKKVVIFSLILVAQRLWLSHQCNTCNKYFGDSCLRRKLNQKIILKDYFIFTLQLILHKFKKNNGMEKSVYLKNAVQDKCKEKYIN